MSEPTFEEILDKLENVVEKLERADLSLEDAIEAYKQGVGLAKEGHLRLSHAERTIEEVSGRTTRAVDVSEILEET